MTHPAIGRELHLLDPATRSDADALEDLLHQDFVEIGSSGRLWTRQQMITALRETPPARKVSRASPQRSWPMARS